MHQNDEWHEVGDGSWEGVFGVEVAGAPIQLSGVMRLVPGDGTCTHDVTITMNVKVPLVGGKIADWAGKNDVKRTLDAEFAASATAGSPTTRLTAPPTASAGSGRSGLDLGVAEAVGRLEQRLGRLVRLADHEAAAVVVHLLAEVGQHGDLLSPSDSQQAAVEHDDGRVPLERPVDLVVGQLRRLERQIPDEAHHGHVAEVEHPYVRSHGASSLHLYPDRASDETRSQRFTPI